jgi:hypothetical protein
MLGSVVQVHLSPPHIPVRRTHPLKIVLAFAVLAVAVLAGAASAHAQLRSIPDDAKRGQLRFVREMVVEIDGAQARLSPGAQIRNTDNRIILPSALPQDSLLVKYLADPSGQVHRVWILTQEEAAKPDKNP